MHEENIEAVKHALTIAREKGFGEVKLHVGEFEFEAILGKAPKPQAASSASTTEEPSAPVEVLEDIKSPVVGYYKASAKPLAVGNTVNSGDVVASVVALGLGNNVESPVDGEVVEVLAEPDMPVMYGQVLAKVKKA